MNRHTLVTLTVLTIAILAVTAATAYLKPKLTQMSLLSGQKVPPASPTTQTPLVAKAAFAAASTWQTGTTQTITITLEEIPSPPPAVIQLEITFNPQVLEIKNIEAGSIWQQSNVLQKTIDQENGRIQFDAGQGFGSQSSHTNEIATLTVTVKSQQTSQTTLTLTDRSVMYTPESEQPVRLTVDPLVINLVK